MALSAQEILKRYQDAMASAQTKARYIEGVNRYQGNPMERAASNEAEALFLTRVQDSVQSGRRRAALLAVPVQRWKGNSTGKGSERLQSGAKAASEKHGAVLQKWAGVYQDASNAAQSLPKGGLDAGMARCRAAAEVMMRAAGKAV